MVATTNRFLSLPRGGLRNRTSKLFKEMQIMNLKAIAVASFMAVAAVPMASMAADKAGTTKTEAGQYASDAAVTAKVKAALLAEKNLKSLDINVETQNGVVQLSGFAVSSAQVDQAVDVATNVKGVKNVKNDIRLKTDTEG